MKNNENQLLQHPYQPNIKLADFEGPLDLLLHLIRQSEMDIYDIPIAEITGQYMQYLRQMQRHQLEVAGEYFVMAATLMAIKSQMLLPKPPVSEDEEPIEEDPREELVEQLQKLEDQEEESRNAAQTIKDNERVVLSLSKENTILSYEQKSIIDTFGSFEDFELANRNLYANYLASLNGSEGKQVDDDEQ